MQSFMSVFVVLAGFGFNISILKLCSEDRSIEEKNYLFRKGVCYSILPQLLTFLIILFCIYNNMLSSDSLINSVFIIYSLGIFPLALDSSILSYLQSLKMIKEYSTVQIITKPIGVILLILLTYYFSLYGYATAIVISYVLTLVVVLIRNKALIFSKLNSVPNPFKLHMNYSFYSMLTNVIGMILISIDIFILNFFSVDRLELGYYSFATIFIGMLGIITRTVLQITHPHFSEKSNNFVKWISSFNKYNRLMNYTLISIFCLSLIFVTIFMTYILNGKYYNSIYYFIVLAFAWLIRDSSAFRGSALFGLGKIRVNFMINLVSLLFHALLIVLFIQCFGIHGVPFAMILGGLVTYVLSFSVFNRIVAKEEAKL